MGADKAAVILFKSLIFHFRIYRILLLLLLLLLLLVILFGYHSNSKILKSLGVGVRGTLRHKLACVLHLREGNNVTESFKSEHLHNESVKAESDTAVGRCTVLEGVGEIAELFLCFLV